MFCSASNRTHGDTDVVLGVTFITYGVIVQVLFPIIFERVQCNNFKEFQLIYVLDMLVMFREKNRRLSCYKIMIALGK